MAVIEFQIAPQNYWEEDYFDDENTLLLLHMDGTDGSTTFIDDNGVSPDHDYGA